MGNGSSKTLSPAPLQTGALMIMAMRNENIKKGAVLSDKRLSLYMEKKDDGCHFILKPRGRASWTVIVKHHTEVQEAYNMLDAHWQSFGSYPNLEP